MIQIHNSAIVSYLGAHNFKDDHTEGIDSSYTTGSLESLAIVEPFYTHCLVTNRDEHSLEVRNITLFHIGQRLQ